MWFIIGLVMGIGLLALVLWLRQQKVRVSWYEILLVIIGSLLVVFSVNNFINFRAEYEAVAAWNTFFIFGLPGFVLLAVAAFLVLWRHLRKGRGERHEEGSALSKTTG